MRSYFCRCPALMSVILDLVASIRSHAEKVSHDIGVAVGKGDQRTLEEYGFGFLAFLLITTVIAILTGIGAIRGMTGCFVASAVYFLVGGIQLKLAALFAFLAAFVTCCPKLADFGVSAQLSDSLEKRSATGAL